MVSYATCVKHILGTLVGAPYVWVVRVYLVVVVFRPFVVVRVKTPTA